MEKNPHPTKNSSLNAEVRTGFEILPTELLKNSHKIIEYA